MDESVIKIVPDGNGRFKAFFADDPAIWVWDDTPASAAGKLLLACRSRFNVRIDDSATRPPPVEDDYGGVWQPWAPHGGR